MKGWVLNITLGDLVTLSKQIDNDSIKENAWGFGGSFYLSKIWLQYINDVLVFQIYFMFWLGGIGPGDLDFFYAFAFGKVKVDEWAGLA